MAAHRLRTWNDYRAEIREYDGVLEYAKAVSASLVGHKTPSTNASYAEQIFVKALSHSVIARRLAPDPERKVEAELWDVPSISAIARCVIDAHDAFVYIAATGVAQEEREFRVLLWEAHDKTRRAKMLTAIGSISPEAKRICTEAEELVQTVVAHPVFAMLRKDLQKKTRAGDPPAFHMSQRELCEYANVNYDYYTAITVQLSNHVHTYPFSIKQLFNFRAGNLDSLRLMALPLQYVIPFLVRMTDGMRDLFPGKTPEPPSRTARSMELWRILSTQGVRSAA